jgi:hypothetical protein
VGPSAGMGTMEKRNPTFTCRESNPGRPAGNLVSIMTELSRLRQLEILGQDIAAMIRYVPSLSEN